MTKELQTIRECLLDGQARIPSTLKKELREYLFGEYKKAIAALDTLTAEPSEDARDIALAIMVRQEQWLKGIYDFSIDQAAALVEDAFQKVREECANEIWNRVNSLFTDQDAAFWKEIEIWSKITGPKVKAAIIGKE